MTRGRKSWQEYIQIFWLGPLYYFCFVLFFFHEWPGLKPDRKELEGKVGRKEKFQLSLYFC